MPENVSLWNCPNSSGASAPRIPSHDFFVSKLDNPWSKPIYLWANVRVTTGCTHPIAGDSMLASIPGLTAVGMPPSPAALLALAAPSLAHLSWPRHRRHRDLFRDGDLDRLLPERAGQYQRRVLHGRARNDGLDRGPELCFSQPGLAGIDGMGRIGVSVRHPGRALVLDRRDSRHALSGHGDDALLLRVQDAFGARLSETALRQGASIVSAFPSRS